MDVFGLKKKTADKFIKNRLQNPVSRKKLKAGGIKTVGAVADIDLFRNYDFTTKLTKELGLLPHQFSFVLLDPTSQEVNNLEDNEVFNEKSFGLYGKIKSPALDDFISKEFDLLINYSSMDWTFTRVVLLRSNAKVIAGFEQEQDTIQDISINVAANRMDAFHNELFKYLKIMKFT